MKLSPLLLAFAFALTACGDPEPAPAVDDGPEPLATEEIADDGLDVEFVDPEPALDASDEVPPSMLMGTWASVDDPSSEVAFFDDMMTDYYDGEDLGSSPYTITDGCDGDPAPVFGITLTGDGEGTCYIVLALSDTVLEYTMAGGRGNTLSFERVPESAT